MNNIIPAIALLALGQVAPTKQVETCVTSECHVKESNFKFLHAPVAAGACEMCHIPKSIVDHTFALKRDGAAMCDFCHIGKTDGAGLHVHQPVQQGECIKCHNPHGSNIRNLIIGDSVGSMCLTCHQDVIKGRTHLHTPVTKGDCLSCHDAHSSILPQLLQKQGRELCRSCHSDVLPSEDKRSAISGQRSVLGIHLTSVLGTSPQSSAPSPQSFFIHEPVTGECSQCHEAHASNETAILKQDMVSLCTSCHADVAKQMAGASVQHSAVVDGRSCLNCHSAHHSMESHLLTSAPIKLCLDCHSTEIVRSDGRRIAGVNSLADPKQHRHGPLTNGDCTGCHSVHGAEHAGLLTQAYTKEFYHAPEVGAYGLCFSCHKQELMLDATTTTATNFRQGEVNLHYVHVTLPGDKGRSCRACHTTHTSHNTKQILDAVPYGEWSVPIRFKATETGGSCDAGCHRARTYDRTAVMDSTKPSK